MLLFQRDFLLLFSLSSSSVVNKPSLHSSLNQKSVTFSPTSWWNNPLVAIVMNIEAIWSLSWPCGGLRNIPAAVWKSVVISHQFWCFKMGLWSELRRSLGLVGNKDGEKRAANTIPSLMFSSISLMTSWGRVESECCRRFEPNHIHSFPSFKLSCVFLQEDSTEGWSSKWAHKENQPELCVCVFFKGCSPKKNSLFSLWRAISMRVETVHVAKCYTGFWTLAPYDSSVLRLQLRLKCTLTITQTQTCSFTCKLQPPHLWRIQQSMQIHFC